MSRREGVVGCEAPGLVGSAVRVLSDAVGVLSDDANALSVDIAAATRATRIHVVHVIRVARGLERLPESWLGELLLLNTQQSVTCDYRW